MVKYRRNPLREEKTDEQKLLSIINGMLPEFIYMRDRLNAVILEMEFYKTIYTEPTHTKIVKIIMKACTEHFGVTKSAIESKSRDTDIRMARQIFMALTYKLTPLSFAKVGAIIGKDHATVIHAKKVVNNSEDPIHGHYKIIERHVGRVLINVEVENKKGVLGQPAPPE